MLLLFCDQSEDILYLNITWLFSMSLCWMSVLLIKNSAILVRKEFGECASKGHITLMHKWDLRPFVTVNSIRLIWIVWKHQLKEYIWMELCVYSFEKIYVWFVFHIWCLCVCVCVVCAMIDTLTNGSFMTTRSIGIQWYEVCLQQDVN